ncbi:MAG TPA: ABC transporter permease [Blastocatellia bacterium]|jgi:putative ABC transport system permease protein|nr:ABC transporter permease [Blastocatellia bacterium]
METLVQDLRYGARMLLQKPAFTLVVVVALAVGIGANSAIFSVVNAVLLRPLPYADPERLVMIWMDNSRINVAEDWHSFPNYTDYRDQNEVLESIAAFNNRSFNITGSGEPERVEGAWMTGSLLPMLGVSPALGRNFSPEEEQPGKDQIVIIGHGLWQRRFGGDPNILGQSIMLNGSPRTVIGVMPQGFAFPTKASEMWVPIALTQQQMANRNAISYQVIGKIKPGVTFEQAKANLEMVNRWILNQNPNQEGYGVNPVLYHDQVVGSVRPALLALLGAVAFVLLIACANVANLLLSRAAARSREIAIRTALGAGRARIIRQLLTESLLLALIGGGVGLLIAYWGLDLLLAISPSDLPRLDQITIDRRVLGFTLGVSLLTGLIFGLVPALQASRPDLTESLKEGGRGSSGGIQGKRIRSGLVVFEVATALVLLICAGLMIKSFMNLQEVRLGFNPDRLLTVRLQLSGTKYREDATATAFYQQLLERVGAMPGVESASAISTLFLSKTPNSTNFTIEGRAPFAPSEQVEVPVDIVTPGFFKAIGVPLVGGREFTPQDAAGTPDVVIINETMAKRFWQGEDPVGKRFMYGTPGNGDPQWMTIVGVVGDVRRTGFDAEVRPETFLPHGQAPARGMMLMVRSTSDPTNLTGAVREAVRSIDGDLPVFTVKPMDALLGDMMAQRRLNMLLFAILAGVALILSAVGIYGVIAYSVTQRTHEIGIRMALGAQRRDIVKMVVGQGMALAAGGVGMGILASVLLTRLMTALLYGVSATDLVTFVAISVLLTLVAVVASFIPARRATRVDPMIALRYE